MDCGDIRGKDDWTSTGGFLPLLPPPSINDGDSILPNHLDPVGKEARRVGGCAISDEMGDEGALPGDVSVSRGVLSLRPSKQPGTILDLASSTTTLYCLSCLWARDITQTDTLSRTEQRPFFL